MHAGINAGFHDIAILGRQGTIDYDVGLIFQDNFFYLKNLIRIDLINREQRGRFSLQLVSFYQIFQQIAALFKSSARNPDMRKNIQVLGALVGDNAADTPGTDYQYPFHVVLLKV